MCPNFHGFVFRDTYFLHFCPDRENRENLDLAKISCYTVHTPLQQRKIFLGLWGVFIGEAV